MTSVQLDLTRYRQPLTHVVKTFQPGEAAGEGEPYRVEEPVELEFDLHKDKARFRIAGTLRTVLELPCSRCLEPFGIPVNLAFDLRYLPRTVNTGDGEREIQEDDLTTAFYENDTIDLGQLMREQFYLALPMKPLCVEDCHGLCVQCGTNLNRGSCSCERDWVDPRLAALAKLKNNQREH